MRTFIVEADGGSRGNPGPAGYGAVVLDAESGETLAEVAEYLGVVTNNVAEYRGLLAGLRAARDLDPNAAVSVRMDSKLVVEQMSGRWQIKHPDLRPLAAEAARILPAGQVSYAWIPRAENKHADRLANEAMDAGGRGEQWSPSVSTADLDTRAARNLASPKPADGSDRAPLTASETPAPETPAPETPAPDTSVPTAEARFPAAVKAPVPAAVPPDLGTPTTFVLLRHGETALTARKRFSGSGGDDPALSDAGREQAERVADALVARGTIQAVVSSPLARCRQTAAAVAARTGLDVVTEPGLRETDFGAWEGLTFGQVSELHPDDLSAWLGSQDVAPTGGGESFATVARRVAEARDRIIERYAGRTVLVVSHVTPVKTLVRLALGAPPDSMFRMDLAAASLSAVAYYADGNAAVRLLNDTSHLR
ncbi:Phosphoserine phosphatase 1 [Streptomyces sp. YIM 130001]|uniref:bifunctional RNase H/acid phosphatase n=1 Tax=Streptomyces sp. YIM 130001 TaxID=2259644 RepID=UPI000E654432|nr:bifunctional RNase H/acid phosphatase [Streptomyces sp. YIM 130001]RII17012.1 Phosphoserine phosphatase 1 [Streptomyces sp. YIM 130001]